MSHNGEQEDVKLQISTFIAAIVNITETNLVANMLKPAESGR